MSSDFVQLTPVPEPILIVRLYHHTGGRLYSNVIKAYTLRTYEKPGWAAKP